MPKTGADCKLYYCASLLDDTNTAANATWIEIGIVGDGSLNFNPQTAQNNTRRGNNGNTSTYVTLHDPEYSFDISWDADEGAFTAVWDAFKDRDLIALAIMDGDIATTGSRGLVGNFSITGFERPEGLQDMVRAQTTVKPATETDKYVVA